MGADMQGTDRRGVTTMQQANAGATEVVRLGLAMLLTDPEVMAVMPPRPVVSSDRLTALAGDVLRRMQETALEVRAGIQNTLRSGDLVLTSIWPRTDLTLLDGPIPSALKKNRRSGQEGRYLNSAPSIGGTFVQVEHPHGIAVYELSEVTPVANKAGAPTRKS